MDWTQVVVEVSKAVVIAVAGVVSDYLRRRAERHEKTTKTPGTASRRRSKKHLQHR